MNYNEKKCKDTKMKKKKQIKKNTNTTLFELWNGREKSQTENTTKRNAQENAEWKREEKKKGNNNKSHLQWKES